MLAFRTDDLSDALSEGHALQRAGRLSEALELFQIYSVYRDAKLHDWLIYNAALLAERLDHLDVFAVFAREVLSVPNIQSAGYFNGRVQMLRLIIGRKCCDADLDEMAALLLDISGTQEDVDLLDQSGLPQELHVTSTAEPSMIFPICDSRPAILASQFPINYDHYAIGLARKRSSRACAVSVYNDAEYISFRGECGVVIDDQFSSKLSSSPSLRLARERARDACQTPTYLPGTAVVLSDKFSGDNYCHWLLDWIPRALVAGELVGRLDWVCARILGSPLQLETMTLLPATAGAVLLRDEGTRWFKFDRIVTAENAQIDALHPTFWGEQSTLESLRNQLLGAAERLPVDNNRRLFISRTDAPSRRNIINEGELYEFLSGRGFEKVVLSGMTLRQQIELFSTASVVVGAHGAGLTNIVFMPKHSQVIELLHVRYGTPAYVRLASSLGLDYHAISCVSDPDSEFPADALTHSNAYNNASLYVNLEECGAYIDRILK